MTSRAGRRALPAALALAGTLAVSGCTSVVTGQASPGPVTPTGTRVGSYPPGQAHSATDVDYPQTPPVGGQHDPVWADCTGTVYDGPIRPENAVHSLEHGAVWVTYDPALATAADVRTLTDLVSGRPGLMLSPYPDQRVAVSLQAWNHQLQVRGAADPRVAEFADLPDRPGPPRLRRDPLLDPLASSGTPWRGP